MSDQNKQNIRKNLTKKMSDQKKKEKKCDGHTRFILSIYTILTVREGIICNFVTSYYSFKEI